MTDFLTSIFTGLASLWDDFLALMTRTFEFSFLGEEYSFPLLGILFGGGLIIALTYAIIKWFTPIL